MSNSTNLKEIKNVTKAIARAVEVKNVIEGMPIAVHPFVDSTLWWSELHRNENKKELNYVSLEKYDLTKKEIFDKWCKEFDSVVDSSKDVMGVYMLWRNPWKMTFIKFCGEYLSLKEYAEFLADAWITEENPNMDANVSVEKAIKYFKKAEKKYLMTEEDYLYYENLPEKVEIYRGVSKGRVKMGLSWTDNKEKAIWFKNRFNEKNDGESVLLKAIVDKKDIIAYFNTRNERELLVDVYSIKDKIEVIL